MGKDYYNLLGVSKDASDDEIKKAYRKLAHQYHPDKESGDEAKFKEINEAYQVLSDPQKRKMYDQFGEAGVSGAAGGGPGGANWEDIMRQAGFAGGQGNFRGGGVEFDLGDIFSEFFGGGGRRGGRRQQKGQDIQIDMKIDFKESAFGAKKDVELYKNVTCEHCSGNAAEPGTPIKECDTCNGSGVVEQVQQSFFGAVRAQAPCTDCQGKGKRAEQECSKCTGSGVQKQETAIEVDIPAGISDQQTIRVSGQGEAGPQGAPSGDLYVNVHVKDHKTWYRDGDDVISQTKVSYATLVMGGKIAVETLDGEVEVKVPAGTNAGKQLRLRGKGVQRLHGSGRGDHIVVVDVHVPKKPNRKYKKVLDELAQLDQS